MDNLSVIEKTKAGRRAAAVSWWLAYALVLAFVLLPGPDRTAFSGLPMATKTQALFFPLLVLGLFCAFFRPRHRVRAVWLIVIAAAAVLKLVFAPMLVHHGWKARYWWVTSWVDAPNHDLRLQRFYQHQTKRWYRIERDLLFTGPSFNLQFVNNHVPKDFYSNEVPRDVRFPLRAQWTGYVRPGGPAEINVKAHGAVTIDVDGARVFTASNPDDAAVKLPLVAGRTQTIRVTYVKGPRTDPVFAIRGLDTVVLPYDRFERLPSSSRARAAILLLGLVSLAALAFAFLNAYAPIGRLFLDEIWEHPSRVWVIGLVALFLAVGSSRSVLQRQVTHVLMIGDDFLTYESQSRQILYDGLLMVTEEGQGTAYFHYPLYPYVLAAAHGLFGEDFGTIPLLNFICLGAVFPLFWLMLRGRIADGALVAVLVFCALLLWRYWVVAGYTATAFSDNLYLPMVLATLWIFVAAMERSALWRFLAAGVLTALTAATRPSFLIFVPFALLAIVLQKRIGTFAARVRACIAYVFGFAGGVSPFTLRNWIVSGKFVLLVASFMMLPMFVYAPEEDMPRTAQIDDNGQILTASGSVKRFLEIVAERPLKVAWLETRKIAFTLGITALGPRAGSFPAIFVVFPIGFVFALKTKRIPWAVQTVLLAFAGSHFIAVIIATPWTYGYKTIVPLHLAFLIGIAFLLPKWGTASVVDAPQRARRERKARPRVSVILPTYNEKDSIRGVIEDFFATGAADEVIVVNNNAAAGTSEEIAGTGAIEIFESEQGYGAACQRGLREATGDFIVLCEPDGTFEVRDIHKLLAYADDFDIVFGSRTSQQFVWRGANMGFFLRAGNWAVAKYMEFLFNGPNLTDVGCTMRLIKRDVAEDLAGQYRVKGSHFGPEMMSLALRRHQYRAVQIPVNYKPRVGQSSVTGDPATALWLGLQMIALITRHAIAATAEETAVPVSDPKRT